MRMKDAKPGLKVVPSRSSRSRTRFWAKYLDYTGQVIEFANSTSIRVEWFPTSSKRATFSGAIMIMRPIDIQPKYT